MRNREGPAYEKRRPKKKLCIDGSPDQGTWPSTPTAAPLFLNYFFPEQTNKQIALKRSRHSSGPSSA